MRGTGILLALMLCLGALPASAEGLGTLETEFEKAISRVTPATVVCLPHGVDRRKVPVTSSGVIVSRRGLVLSDGDVGVWFERKKGEKPKIHRSDDIEVRIPDLRGEGSRAYRAKVLRRDKDLDTSLLRIENLPSGRHKAPLSMGSSDELVVGDFVFVMGNAFGMAGDVPPTLTAGVVSAAVPVVGTSARGKFDTLYVSAAVNPGVNGGPVADASGRLVGTVSTFVAPTDPYQFLGKVVPIDRLRAHYADMEEAKELFPARPTRGLRSKASAKFSQVIQDTARRAGQAAVVALTIERKKDAPFKRRGPGAKGGLIEIPGSSKTISGLYMGERKWVVTCLYNLTNVGPLVHRGWNKVAKADAITYGLEGIKTCTAHFADGSETELTVHAWDPRRNLVLLKAEAPISEAATPLEVAPASALEVGRFVLALGAPRGKDRLPDPLLTLGMLSKRHDAEATDRWRLHWQTDAGVTDANAGGAAVNVRGELYGMLSIWSPVRHGRNSGIGFILPASELRPAVTAMSAGKRPPLVGVSWGFDEARKGFEITKLAPDGAASKAGLGIGDLITHIDGKPMDQANAPSMLLHDKWSGDTIELTRVVGGAEPKTVELVLGAR